MILIQFMVKSSDYVQISICFWKGVLESVRHFCASKKKKKEPRELREAFRNHDILIQQIN